MINVRRITSLCAMALLALIGGAADAASTQVTYQGALRDSAGDPVPDGAYAVTITIYNVDTAGAPLWQENHPAVPVNGGAFSVLLGDISAFGTLFQSNPNLFLEVAADTGSGLTTYLPRVPLTAAPYAQQADNADTLDGLDAADFATPSGVASALSTHDTNAAAHANLQLSAGQIASGTLNNARLNMGDGGGIDADSVDGLHATDIAAATAASVAAHDASGAAHADIRADLADHEASGTAHADIRADLAAHETDAAAHSNMNINGGQIVNGTVNIARLPTGTAGTQVALGDHTHNLQTLGGAVTDGQVPDNITILNATNADTVDGLHATQLIVPSASTAEVQAGSESGKYVAPSTLLGAVGFAKYFQSADFAVTAGAAFNIAHGLGRVPTLIQPVLKCVTADQGYAVGDLLPIYANLPHDELDRGIRVVTDATNLQCKIGNNGQPFILFHKTGGQRVALTYANWRIFLRAWG